MSLANGEPRALAGKLKRVVYLGTDTQYWVGLPGGELVEVRCQNLIGNSSSFSIGDEVVLEPRDGAARLLVD